MKKRIFAIPAKAIAIPVNPNSAASRETTRKMIAHDNMKILLVPDPIIDPVFKYKEDGIPLGIYSIGNNLFRA